MHQCPNCNEEHCWIGNLDSNNIKENESVCCNCGKRFTNREIDVYNACLLEHSEQIFDCNKKGATKMNQVERNELKLKKFFMQWCPDIENIIFSKPATICILKDGRKGIVKVRHGDRWSAEKGMLYAYIKASKKPKFPNAELDFEKEGLMDEILRRHKPNEKYFFHCGLDFGFPNNINPQIIGFTTNKE